MLARLATTGTRGRVFGFHRAMDHAGAIVGPLVATAILFFAPGGYRLVFALTLIPGAVAVALLFLVKEPPNDDDGGRAAPHTPGASAADAVRLPNRLLAFFAVLLVFSLGNSADAFLLLRLSEVLGSAAYVPLLWSGLHVVKAGLSTWGGALSDRLGRKNIIALGWSIYAVVYLGFATAREPVSVVAWFLVYGVYFALTEGAEKALVADLTPPRRAGVAFGLYNAALGVGALTASVAFGFLYERFGTATAFGAGAALAMAAALLLAFVPTNPHPQPLTS
jgi:MFS family permease